MLVQYSAYTSVTWKPETSSEYTLKMLVSSSYIFWIFNEGEEVVAILMW